MSKNDGVLVENTSIGSITFNLMDSKILLTLFMPDEHEDSGDMLKTIYLTDSEDRYMIYISDEQLPKKLPDVTLFYNSETQEFSLFKNNFGDNTNVCSFAKFISADQGSNIKGTPVKKGGNQFTFKRGKLIKELVSQIRNFTKEFQSRTLTKYTYFYDDNDDIELQNAILEVYQEDGCIKDKIKGVKTLTTLSFDMGTGYYLGLLHKVRGEFQQGILSLCAEYNILNKGKANQSVKFQLKTETKFANINEKVSSTVHISDEIFNSDYSIPMLIQKAFNGDEKARGMLVDNVRIGTDNSTLRKDEPIFTVQHYKKYLYYQDDILIDPMSMCSNVYITIEANRKDEHNQPYKRTVDIYHIYLLLVYQIYMMCKESTNKHLSLEKVDMLKIAIPINAKTGHQAFMIKCFDTIFNYTGNNITMQVITEPEAAFNFIATDSDKREIFKNYKHAVLIDGGDGTFDYLYVEKFNDVWSLQKKEAYNYAGTALYYRLKEELDKLFDNQLELQYLNKIYEAIKKRTGKELLQEGKSIDIIMSDIFGREITDEVRNVFALLAEKINENTILKITSGKNVISQSQLKDDLMNNPKKFVQYNISLDFDGYECIFNPVCDEFIKNFEKFNKIVQRSNNQKAHKILYIFVGGLAASETIKAKMQQKFDMLQKANLSQKENKNEFMAADKPQVAIVKGIPISRTNISQRNFNECSERNLYILYTMSDQQINSEKLYGRPFTSHTSVCLKNNKDKQDKDLKPSYYCLHRNGKIMYCPQLLFKMNMQLMPGQAMEIQNLILFLDVNLHVVFYKSKSTKEPPFFNISVKNQKASFVMLDKDQEVLTGDKLYLANIRIEEAKLSPEIKQKMKLDRQLSIGTGKYIKATIGFFLEHENFQPDPMIRIYGNYTDDITGTEQRIQLKDVKIWDWYRQKSISDDAELEFEVHDDSPPDPPKKESKSKYNK